MHMTDAVAAGVRPLRQPRIQERIMTIDTVIDRLLQVSPSAADDAAFALLDEVWAALRSGAARAARKDGDRWVAQPRVKEAILWAFRAGALRDVPETGGEVSFSDKHNLPVQVLSAESGRRVVPGGTTVRDGAYIARGVIIMPPSYINVGAYVDADTMVDSHALVGSCAQIGRNVHLSAGVQVGGVLEPIGAVPVIIEDDVMVGGNSGIYEGTIVRSGAVIGTGVILNASTPVYDLARGVVHRKTSDGPLEIPAGAVVVQGSRPARGEFAEREGIQLYTPVIVKYRDARTDAATALEDSLREA
jgi:2,3,4,5-tetrahydropyridine-2,6-dicarboxylate N-succinyltransferase